VRVVFGWMVGLGLLGTATKQLTMEAATPQV